MATLIQLRRGNTSQWNGTNPILAVGEPGWDSEYETLKIGDGETPYNSLRPTYANGAIQTLSLLAESWVGETAPYTQRVTVDKMLPDFNPNVGLDPSSVYDVALVEVQEYSKLYKGESGNGYIDFYATDKPKCDLNLTIKRL